MINLELSFILQLDGQMVERSCYPAIQHADGDVIKVRDTVLVCSGPKKTDIPYVAKIAALWERENSRKFIFAVVRTSNTPDIVWHN